MIYAYDQNVQLPVKDLYDNLVVAMSIAAAKNMYEKGQLELKDFKKEFGDFYSPIQSDMDWYNKNVTGRVKDALNYMYANGIDPVRSSEGRAMVSLIINTIPVGEIAKKRQAAEDVKMYKKNRDDMIKAGLYNEAYERAMLGGQTLEEWDGSLGNWTATSPMIYKDLNNRYKHLFDGMQLSYDEEESKKMPGYIVKTKSKKDMRTILDSNLVDLKEDPQFKYDVANIKSAIRSSNPTASELELDNKATEILKNQIIDRNHEVYGKTVETDPYYLNNVKFKQQQALQSQSFRQLLALQREKHNNEIEEIRERGKYSGRNTKDKTQYNHMDAQMLRGMEHFATVNAGDKKRHKDNIISATFNVGKTMNSGDWDTNKKEFFKKNVIKNQYSPAVLQQALHKDKKDLTGNRSRGVYVDETDMNNLYSYDEVASSTLGVSSPIKYTDRSNLSGKSQYYQMEITGDAITIPGRDLRAHLYFKVRLYNNDGTHKGDYWYELQRGVENASTKKIVSGKNTATMERFEYEWDPDRIGKYNDMSTQIEKALGNNTATRTFEEDEDFE